MYSYLSNKLKYTEPKARKIELRSKLLYYALETGLPKHIQTKFQREIILGKIQDIEFDDDNRTFKFVKCFGFNYFYA